VPLHSGIGNEVKIGLVLVEVGDDDGVEGGLANAAEQNMGIPWNSFLQTWLIASRHATKTK